MINLLSKTDDFMNDKFTSKTSLGRSGHVRFQTFNPSLHSLG